MKPRDCATLATALMCASLFPMLPELFEVQLSVASVNSKWPCQSAWPGMQPRTSLHMESLRKVGGPSPQNSSEETGTEFELGHEFES